MQLAKEIKGIPKEEYLHLDKLQSEIVNHAVLEGLSAYLERIKSFYGRMYKNFYRIKSELKAKEDPEEISELKRNYYNENLEEFVTNKNEFQRIVEYNGELIQKIDPIYLDPESKFLKAHFYAPRKLIFGHFLPTIWVNVMVLWINAIILFLLYFRVLKRLMDFFENLSMKRRHPV